MTERHSKPQQYTALVIDYSKEAFSTMVIGSLDSIDHWEDIQIVQYDVDFQLGYNATEYRHFLNIKHRLDQVSTLVGSRGKFFHLILMGDQASQEEFQSVADWVLHDRIERWDQKQFIYLSTATYARPNIRWSASSSKHVFDLSIVR